MPVRVSRILIFLSLFLAPFGFAHATGISNGASAVDLIGQYDDSLSDPQPVYTKSAAGNGPNKLGFAGNASANPFIIIDDTYHRMFYSDWGNNRVLVYNLNNDNTLIDHIPDYVLGQPNFYTNATANTAAGMNGPAGLVLATSSNMLYVAETGANRIKIFDVAAITNGEDAVHVLGQADFTTATAGNSQTGLNTPIGIDYDYGLGYLFVAEYNGSRVKIFNVGDGITDNEPAINILGQSDWSGVVTANTQTGFVNSLGVEYDHSARRLFVTEIFGNRVKVFDLSDGITDNEPAVNILGQSGYLTATAANSQTGLNRPEMSLYDPVTRRLFVSETTGNRVKVFDLSDGITDNEPAINVLGQTSFLTASAPLSQMGMASPRGLGYDSGNHRLYVADGSYSRVMVFDVDSITDGENAVDGFGQYDDSLSDPQPIYTKGGNHDTPNKLGLISIAASHSSSVIDNTNHRLFTVDSANNRVLVYSLTAGNVLSDHIPDYVLGQPNFATNTAIVSQDRLSAPRGVAYDAAGSRLFVSGSNRITIYDLSGGITNGMNASNVLGQTTWTGSGSGNSSSTLSTPVGIAYSSSAGGRLFVAESGAHRVKIFDVASITDGEDAAYILGQSNETGASLANTQAGMNTPQDVAYEADRDYLYVAQSGNNRVTVYNLSNGISNGEAAMSVLGQALFTDTAAANTAGGMNVPTGVAYDEVGERLFVSQATGNRVTVYDTASTTDGEDAAYVLGQSAFTTITAATTQAGVSAPRDVMYDSTSDRIFVSQSGNSRVSIFDVSPYVASDSGSSGGGGSIYNSNNRSTVYTTSAPNPNASILIQTNTNTVTNTSSVVAFQATPPVPAISKFSKDLFFGVIDNDVKELQKFLNSHGFVVAKTGNGSSGNEITTFGPATRRALSAFQKANKISPSAGYFGPLTRTVVNKMLSVR